MKKLLLQCLPILLIFGCTSNSRNLTAADSLEVQKSVDSVITESRESNRKKYEEKSLLSPVKFLKSWVTKNSIGTPEANITLKNTGNTGVDGLKIMIFCYNNFDEQVIGGTGGAMGLNVQNCILQEKLDPGQTETYKVE